MKLQTFKEGGYEVNPPFVENIMLEAAEIMQKSLKIAQKDKK